MANTPESLEYDGASDRLLDEDEVWKFLEDVIWPALENLYPDRNFMDNAMPGEEVEIHRRIPGAKGLALLSFHGMCYLDHDNTVEGEEPPTVCGVLLKVETMCPDKMVDLIDALQDSETPEKVEAILDDPSAYKPWMTQRYNFTDEDVYVYVEETYQIRETDDEDEIYWEPPVFTNHNHAAGVVYGHISDELRLSDRIEIESALRNLGLSPGLSIVKRYQVRNLNAVFRVCDESPN